MWLLAFADIGGDVYIVDSVFSDITLLKPTNWVKLIENPPINIGETNESEDTLSAIVLFTVLNKYSITAAVIDDENNLILEFENKTKILMPSNVDDRPWILKERKGELVTFESGKLLIKERKANRVDG